MRFVTYESPAGPARVGRLDGDTVLDVGFDGDMVAFIEAGAPIGAERPVPAPGCSRRWSPARSATSSPSRGT